jgi:hypothetical protein
VTTTTTGGRYPGEQEAKTVEHVWVHDDTMIDLAVDGEVITTTEDHPFWSATDHRFERTDELAPGEKLLTADGRSIAVSGLELGSERQSPAYNLSVEGIHTYHVGAMSILVHNACFGSGRPPHRASVTVTRNGEEVINRPYVSGNMTPEEAALGFPRSSLATHTEARSMRELDLQAGDTVVIRGQYSPCPSCKGAMNRAAADSGASITYEWPEGIWRAGRR